MLPPLLGFPPWRAGWLREADAVGGRLGRLGRKARGRAPCSVGRAAQTVVSFGMGLNRGKGGKGGGLSFSRGPFMLKSASVNAGGLGTQPGEM